MRKLIANEFMSLDGVVQAPGGPDEDTSGGFRHGGWHMRYLEPVSQKWIADAIIGAGGFVLGRRTWEIFAAYWPKAGKEEQVIAEPLNTKPKYVASRTLKEPLAWQNSTLLGGDVARAIADLKQQDGGDLYTIGSSQFVQWLIERDLVDEFWLMIDPLILGGGKRIFRDDAVRRDLRLVRSEVTSTGAIIAMYARATA